MTRHEERRPHQSDRAETGRRKRSRREAMDGEEPAQRTEAEEKLKETKQKLRDRNQKLSETK